MKLCYRYSLCVLLALFLSNCSADSSSSAGDSQSEETEETDSTAADSGDSDVGDVEQGAGESQSNDSADQQSGEEQQAGLPEATVITLPQPDPVFADSESEPGNMRPDDSPSTSDDSEASATGGESDQTASSTGETSEETSEEVTEETTEQSAEEAGEEQARPLNLLGPRPDFPLPPRGDELTLKVSQTEENFGFHGKVSLSAYDTDFFIETPGFSPMNTEAVIILGVPEASNALCAVNVITSAVEFDGFSIRAEELCPEGLPRGVIAAPFEVSYLVLTPGLWEWGEDYLIEAKRYETANEIDAIMGSDTVVRSALDAFEFQSVLSSIDLGLGISGRDSEVRPIVPQAAVKYIPGRGYSYGFRTAYGSPHDYVNLNIVGIFRKPDAQTLPDNLYATGQHLADESQQVALKIPVESGFAKKEQLLNPPAPDAQATASGATSEPSESGAELSFDVSTLSVFAQHNEISWQRPQLFQKTELSGSQLDLALFNILDKNRFYTLPVTALNQVSYLILGESGSLTGKRITTESVGEFKEGRWRYNEGGFVLLEEQVSYGVLPRTNGGFLGDFFLRFGKWNTDRLPGLPEFQEPYGLYFAEYYPLINGFDLRGAFISLPCSGEDYVELNVFYNREPISFPADEIIVQQCYNGAVGTNIRAESAYVASLPRRNGQMLYVGEGATIEREGFKLVMPTDTTTKDAFIGVEKVAEAERQGLPEPAMGELGTNIVKLTPHGVDAQKKMTLTLPCEGTSQQIIYRLGGPGQNIWEVHDSQPCVDSKVETEISTFSFYYSQVMPRYSVHVVYTGIKETPESPDELLSDYIECGGVLITERLVLTSRDCFPETMRPDDEIWVFPMDYVPAGTKATAIWRGLEAPIYPHSKITETAIFTRRSSGTNTDVALIFMQDKINAPIDTIAINPPKRHLNKSDTRANPLTGTMPVYMHAPSVKEDVREDEEGNFTDESVFLKPMITYQLNPDQFELDTTANRNKHKKGLLQFDFFDSKSEAKFLNEVNQSHFGHGLVADVCGSGRWSVVGVARNTSSYRAHTQVSHQATWDWILQNAKALYDEHAVATGASTIEEFREDTKFWNDEGCGCAGGSGINCEPLHRLAITPQNGGPLNVCPAFYSGLPGPAPDGANSNGADRGVAVWNESPDILTPYECFMDPHYKPMGFTDSLDDGPLSKAGVTVGSILFDECCSISADDRFCRSRPMLSSCKQEFSYMLDELTVDDTSWVVRFNELHKNEWLLNDEDHKGNKLGFRTLYSEGLGAPFGTFMRPFYAGFCLSGKVEEDMFGNPRCTYSTKHLDIKKLTPFANPGNVYVYSPTSGDSADVLRDWEVQGFNFHYAGMYSGFGSKLVSRQSISGHEWMEQWLSEEFNPERSYLNFQEIFERMAGSSPRTSLTSEGQFKVWVAEDGYLQNSAIAVVAYLWEDPSYEQEADNESLASIIIYAAENENYGDSLMPSILSEVGETLPDRLMVDYETPNKGAFWKYWASEAERFGLRVEPLWDRKRVVFYKPRERLPEEPEDPPEEQEGCCSSDSDTVYFPFCEFGNNWCY